MHASAPAAIWSCVCAGLGAGVILKAIWNYVHACFSFGGDMDLRLFMFESRNLFESDIEFRVCIFRRRSRFGVEILHVWVPGLILSCVFAVGSTGCDLEVCLCMFGCRRRSAKCNVAVGRVSCVLRVSAAGEAANVYEQGGCPVHLLRRCR